MKLLDLYCGMGGASMGYHLAGWDVYGVDINPQPNYPFPFFRYDALKVKVKGFDLVHASPPCQRWTVARGIWARDHPDLLTPTRERLEGWGGPYIIENVPLAPLIDPVTLCGTMFGLGVFRHRGFETTLPVKAPDHASHDGRIGDGRYFTVAGHTGLRSSRDGHGTGLAEQWRTAMGISWGTAKELAQAVPPAYTQYIGEQIQ
jgi:DNA (cytosine-5)-methyltransferase 1